MRTLLLVTPTVIVWTIVLTWAGLRSDRLMVALAAVLQ